jgi:hypothetical protein
MLQVCECGASEVRTIGGEAVVIARTVKRYQHSFGCKITVQMEEMPLNIHFVIFESSPFFKLTGVLNVGDLCTLKGIVKQQKNEKNDQYEDVLLTIFNLEI